VTDHARHWLAGKTKEKERISDGFLAGMPVIRRHCHHITTASGDSQAFRLGLDVRSAFQTFYLPKMKFLLRYALSHTSHKVFMAEEGEWGLGRETGGNPFASMAQRNQSKKSEY